MYGIIGSGLAAMTSSPTHIHAPIPPYLGGPRIPLFLECQHLTEYALGFYNVWKVTHTLHPSSGRRRLNIRREYRRRRAVVRLLVRLHSAKIQLK